VFRRTLKTHRLAFSGRLGVIAVGALVLSLGLAACGDSGASKEELAKAAHKGAVHRAEQERLRKLERRVREANRVPKSGSAEPNPAPAPESSPTPSGTDCGNSLTAGPETSCPFAENVRAVYENEIGVGSGNIHAYSPANETIYPMYCTAGSPHECSGAISATVYFP
jgi:hypothetical protein